MKTAFERRDILLSAKGIDLLFDQRPVLKNVDLEIRDVVRPDRVTGQIVALLGPSGMGKTQLFRVLAGLAKPAKGTITAGASNASVEPGTIGLVAQRSPLFEHRTVISNLVIAGRQRGLSRRDAREKAIALLERFGVSDVCDRYPALLSGGERQRVAIAQQFMLSEGSGFLLMDEPFSGLDPVALESVLALVRELADSDEQRTLVISTHDISAAVSIADTLWLLGRDHDESGAPIPGARVQAVIDLAERGVAWSGLARDSAFFLSTAREVREQFVRL